MPAESYSLILKEIDLLSDALAELDGPGATEHQRLLIERGHRALMRALGQDVALVYGPPDDEIVLPMPK